MPEADKGRFGVESIAVDPSDASKLYIAAGTYLNERGSDGAILRSTDGGDLCANADWPRRGLDLQGDKLPLALAVPYLPERSDGRPWALNGDLDLAAQLRPVGNAWRGTAKVTSAAGGVRNRARARRDLVSYRDLVLDAQFDPQRINATLGAAAPWATARKAPMPSLATSVGPITLHWMPGCSVKPLAASASSVGVA